MRVTVPTNAITGTPPPAAPNPSISLIGETVTVTEGPGATVTQTPVLTVTATEPLATTTITVNGLSRSDQIALGIGLGLGIPGFIVAVLTLMATCHRRRDREH